MQYHSLSLADNGLTVDLVGYAGSTPMLRLLSHENITITHIPTPQKIKPGLSRVVYLFHAIWRVAFQFVTILFVLLFKLRRPDFILVQVGINTYAHHYVALMFLFVTFIRTRLRFLRFLLLRLFVMYALVNL
jgi:hypothetical protein